MTLVAKEGLPALHCCYAYSDDLFVKQLQPGMTCSASHSNAYPWTPPAGAPLEMKKHLLDDVLRKLSTTKTSERQRLFCRNTASTYPTDPRRVN